MKSFKQYILPYYPEQVSPEDDNGEWVTGDPTVPIERHKKDTWKVTLKKADRQVVRDRM
jgi:hypothetical protein